MANGKIVVMGGDGFIGRQVCRLAVETRHQVISISRSGYRGRHTAAWQDAVDWVAADAFHTADWRDYLRHADAVVDCIGIAVERPKEGLTYDRMNGEAAIVASKVAAEMGVGSFVFVSAAPECAVIFPRAYMDAKRRAETFIQSNHRHWAVLRPAFVYGWDRLWTLPMGPGLRVAAHLPVVGSRLRPFSPLAAEVVATAALRAAMEPNVAGILDVPAIERLGRSLLRDWQPRATAKVA